AADPRRAVGLALHADLRTDPGDPADPGATIPAGVASLAAQTRGRDAEAAELRRAVSARVPPHDPGNGGPVRVRLRRRLRRHSAHAADRTGPAPGFAQAGAAATSL